MHGFKISKLKELLSAQMLFNVGINLVASRGTCHLPQDLIFFEFHQALADNLLALVAEVVAEKDASSPEKSDKKTH